MPTELNHRVNHTVGKNPAFRRDPVGEPPNGSFCYQPGYDQLVVHEIIKVSAKRVQVNVAIQTGTAALLAATRELSKR